MKKLYFFFLIPALFSLTFRSQAQPLSFADPIDISQGSVSGVTSLDAADFNQDGLLDVVGKVENTLKNPPLPGLNKNLIVSGYGTKWAIRIN